MKKIHFPSLRWFRVLVFEQIFGKKFNSENINWPWTNATNVITMDFLSPSVHLIRIVTIFGYVEIISIIAFHSDLHRESCFNLQTKETECCPFGVCVWFKDSHRTNTHRCIYALLTKSIHYLIQASSDQHASHISPIRRRAVTKTAEFSVKLISWKSFDGELNFFLGAC